MKVRLLLALMLVMSLAGCASYTYTDAPPKMGILYSQYAYVGYEGTIRPIADIGVITTDGLLQIHTVNGTKLENFRTFKSRGFYSGGRFQLHLQPGTYSLTMGFHDDRGSGRISWSVTDITKTVTIKAGDVLHLSVWQQRNEWGANQSDGRAALPTISSDFQELLNKK